MSTQFKINYGGQDYYYTSHLEDKTVDSQAYTAATISRGEIFYEFDKQGFSLEADADLVPFSYIKTDEPQVPLTVSVIDNNGVVLMAGEVEKVTIRTSNNLMKLKVDALKTLRHAHIPVRAITTSCNFALYQGYDKTSGTAYRCPVNRTSFDLDLADEANMSINGSNPKLLDYSTGGLTVNAWKLGQAHFKDNSDRVIAKNYIISNTANSITFLADIVVAFGTGANQCSKITLFKGCAKNADACGSSKFNVMSKYGGFPSAFRKPFGNEQDLTKVNYVPIVYGSDIKVNGVFIYGIDNDAVYEGAVVLDRKVKNNYRFIFNSFGVSFGQKLDTLHEVYIKDGDTDIYVTNPSVNLTNGQTTGIRLGKANKVNIGWIQQHDPLVLFNDKWRPDKGTSTIGQFDPSTMYFYDGTQTSVDSYYSTYAPTAEAENTMIFQNVSYCSIGFNKIAQDYSTASDTTSLTKLKADPHGNVTQAYLGMIEVDESEDPDLSYNFPDLVASVTYCPALDHADVTDPDVNKEIGSGDNKGANPVNVIYDLLVNYLGIAKADINGSNFKTARNTIAGESAPLALNLIVDKRTKVKELINKICTFADLLLIKKRKAGTTFYLWDITVMRSTNTGTGSVYPAGHQFNETNTNSVIIHESTFASIYTDLIIEIEHPDTGVKQGLKFVNENARQIVGGIREKKIDFGFKIKNNDTGSPILRALASREASKLTRPLMQISFDYPFSTTTVLSPGDVIYYKNDQYGITSYKTFRVKEVSGITENSLKMKCKAIELWQEGDFVNVPEAWRVPTIPTAGTLGDRVVIPALPEQAFPYSGAMGWFEQTSTKSAADYQFWATKPLKVAPSRISAPLVLMGEINQAFTGTSFFDDRTMDDSGALNFEPNPPEDGNINFWGNIDIPDDDFDKFGGYLGLIYESATKYELVLIQKMVENAPDIRVIKMIRNIFGGYDYNETFGTEGRTYASGSKIYIYRTGAGYANFNRHIKGDLIDGDDFSGGVAGDKYFDGAYRIRYKNGIAPVTSTTLPRPEFLDYSGSSLVINPFTSVTPYPVDDLSIFKTTVTSSTYTQLKTIYLQFNPTVPRGPYAYSSINEYKEGNQWGFRGTYYRSSLPDYQITIGNIILYIDPIAMRWIAHNKYGPKVVGSSSLISNQTQAYTGKKSFGSVGGVAGIDGAFLDIITGDEYLNGYLRLTVVFDVDVSGSISSVSIQSKQGEYLSQAVSVTI